MSSGTMECARAGHAAGAAGDGVVPKGVWRRHTGNGLTSNALVPDSLTDLGGGACFNDARVDVAVMTSTRGARRGSARVS